MLSCYHVSKVMGKRMISFLDKHDILFKSQYVFRARHSTQQAIIKFIKEISREIGRNEYTVGIVLELSKAFGTLIMRYYYINLNIVRYEELQWNGLISRIRNIINYKMFHFLAVGYRSDRFMLLCCFSSI